MYAAMTIEEFNAFLTSKQNESTLQKILRKLTKVQKPEDVILLADKPTGKVGGPTTQTTWSGWALT